MDKAFDVKMIADFIPTLAGYLPITLYILALSLIFGFILGVLLSLPRIYKVPILDQFARVYISFFRGTPIMVQLFIVFTEFRHFQAYLALTYHKWIRCMLRLRLMH